MIIDRLFLVFVFNLFDRKYKSKPEEISLNCYEGAYKYSKAMILKKVTLELHHTFCTFSLQNVLVKI